MKVSGKMFLSVCQRYTSILRQYYRTSIVYVFTLNFTLCTVIVIWGHGHQWLLQLISQNQISVLRLSDRGVVAVHVGLSQRVSIVQ